MNLFICFFKKVSNNLKGTFKSYSMLCLGGGYSERYMLLFCDTKHTHFPSPLSFQHNIRGDHVAHYTSQHFKKESVLHFLFNGEGLTSEAAPTPLK